MSEYKKLYRARSGRMIAGVCAGLGQYFGVDPTLIRLGVLAVTLFGGFEITIPGYLIMMIVVPEEPAGVYTSTEAPIQPSEVIEPEPVNPDVE